MHQFLEFIFGIELYMFQAGFLSIIRSLVLYTQQQVYVTQSIPKINLRNYCISLVLSKEYITMHGPLNVRSVQIYFVCITQFITNIFKMNTVVSKPGGKVHCLQMVGH